MNRKRPTGLWTALAGVGALLAVGILELVLWVLSGFGPLILLALLQLLGAGINLCLLLPAGRQRELPEKRELPAGKLRFLRQWLQSLHRLGYRLLNLWNQKHRAVMGFGTLVVLFVANLLFWPRALNTPDSQGLQWIWPVVLVVLFVVSLAAEKWLQHAKANANARWAAIIGNARSLLLLGRIAQLLTAAAMVMTLTGLYDPQLILRIALAVLFAYETVMLLLSLSIRILRKELDTNPVLALSPRGVDGKGLLHYLEENTGITMRSLWSIRLIRKVLPAAALFVVLLTWLSTGLVQVESHQEGAVYRLGTLQEETLKPGLHLTLPWPFDKVETHDTTTVRKVTIGYEPNGTTSDNTWTDGHSSNEYRLLLGGGNEIVCINLTVEYRINDLNAYLRSSANVHSLISASSYEIVTARTISTDLDALLSTDRTKFSETFQQELVGRLEHYHCGVEITEVVLESIHPPVEVAPIYQRVISAEIQAEQLLLEAQRDASLTLTAAHQQALTETSYATTRQHHQLATANGTVAEFLASLGAYNTYPSAYTYYKYNTTATQAYKKGVVIIVGEDIDTSRLVIGDLSRPVPEDPYFIEHEVEEEYYQ